MSAVFKKTIDLVDQVTTSENFSPDGKAVTVLFRNLQTAHGVQGQPNVVTRALTVDLPIEGDGKSPVAVRQFVRGFVSDSETARAVLLVQAAGKTTLVNLHECKTKGDGKKKRDRTGSDVVAEIPGTLPAGAGYQVTFFLLVERTSATDPGAMVQVDAFDVEIAK